ncbi:MAG: DUF1343 domain-containing protein [Bacteroidetes bacterium HGW-Bacteroidetes-16]|jgi:uncharacterized protein YbbC (DUF1343 family)|nr:MAG: DUF1343 domain-containing protein [Bacteroidetes bacterium HGW-Bacteroidetes-16]
MRTFGWLISSLFIFMVFPFQGCTQNSPQLVEYDEIVTGAQQMHAYLPLLKGKQVALVANQASLVGETHLTDTLLSSGILLKKIFCPEHGFRGNADAGELVNDSIDPVTGIPLVSLYGDHKKPTQEDLAGIDVVVFDLQDVGVRYYTYVSTSAFVLEACAENGIAMVLLDRPNPNGYLIDGPVLEVPYRSFVGMHTVPIAYGMTIGEYIRMVLGEKWINQSETANLVVIPLKQYNHQLIVKLKVKPSPNLPTWQSVYLYPSLCLFEGTDVSVARGTAFPFEAYGAPWFHLGSFSFTPKSIQGMSTHPKFEGLVCFGQNLKGVAENYLHNPIELNLTWLITAYQISPDKEKFFNTYFDKLAGSDQLRKDIIAGKDEKQIRESWKCDLDHFKEIREKYLLYP